MALFYRCHELLDWLVYVSKKGQAGEASASRSLNGGVDKNETRGYGELRCNPDASLRDGDGRHFYKASSGRIGNYQPVVLAGKKISRYTLDKCFCFAMQGFD